MGSATSVDGNFRARVGCQDDDVEVSEDDAAAVPPATVLVEFGLDGPVQRLPGGEGTCVRVGDVVLKPAGDDAVAVWTTGVLASLAGSHDFRVPDPIRATSGAFVVDGWAATRYVPGEPGPDGRWAEVLAAGRSFHQALRDVERPPVLGRRVDPWARADQVAWGEADVGVPAHVATVLQRLRDVVGPVRARPQLVHGDLTGNVLFAPGQPPVIIDFSPYWRPVGYADAIVAADGLLYHDAGDELVALAVPGPVGAQLLVRAVIFRLVTFALLTGGEGESAAGELARFERVAEIAAERVAHGSR